MKTEPLSVRIIPAKGTALFTFFIFAAILFVFYITLLHDVGTVIVNGKDVHREDPHAPAIMILFLVIPVAGLILQGLRLLPGSPFDFLEIGPQGFTVGKLFGRRHRRWDEVSGFSVGSIALTNPPISWVKVESTRPIRFFISGYMRIKLFTRAKTQMQEIAAWLDLVRVAYAFGDGGLPPPPEALAATIVPLNRGPLTRAKGAVRARSSVIERRRQN
jgi:hypothetical protein